MTDLKPRPFCGGQARYSPYDGDGSEFPSVQCEACYAEVFENTKGRAVKAWNRRVDLLARFRTLWAAYHAALAVDTFRMTQEQREQNEIEVAEAFQALTRLSQEGM